MRRGESSTENTTPGRESDIMDLDHIGIAVRQLDAALPAWERTLGTRGSSPEVVESQRVRVSFLEVGETHFELLEPTSQDSPIARFIEKRGEGIHHLALRVPDLAAKLSELKQSGTRLIDEAPRKGARGRLVAFAHPTSFGGVLTEFVQLVP